MARKQDTLKEIKCRDKKKSSSPLYMDCELNMDSKALANLEFEERNSAFEKYKIIEPYINKIANLKSIAKTKGIPLRTLTLWCKKYNQLGIIGLARKTRDDKGQIKSCDVELQKSIEGLYLSNPDLSYATLYRLLINYCHTTNSKIPSYRTVCRIIENIPDSLVTLSTKGSKAYQQKYDLLYIRSAENPNDIWQADHALLDVETLNDKLKLQKPWLTIIMDDCSRAICGYELSFLSPSASKTALCLRHAIWRKPDPKWIIFGVPHTLYTDHGSDFTSEHIGQVCADLKVRLIHSTIGQPRGRGKIERFFRTLDQKLLSVLRQKIPQNISPENLDLKILNQLVYEFIIEYNHGLHSEIKMSPTHRWQMNGFIPQILESLEELDLLLITVPKSRKILRDGIHFQGLRYMDPILAEYVGEYVLLRYHPSDITSVRVFYKNNFLCQALCLELSQKKIGIKEIQRIRTNRRKQLRKQFLERKSLVEAIIEANNKELQFLSDEEIPLVEKDYTPNLKLYKHD